ncbi:MAG: 3-isopropylmalate dehydratase [bacterium]
MVDHPFRARAWVFGNNIDTDQIVPGPYLMSPLEEQCQHALEAISPGFAEKFERGSALIVGANFGCGSAREFAPQVLKHLGVSVVVAESFGRIFFRNAIALGLPVLAVRNVLLCVKQGDEVEIDLRKGTVMVPGGILMQGEPLNRVMLDCLKKGGILKVLQDEAMRDEPHGRGSGG